MPPRLVVVMVGVIRPSLPLSPVSDYSDVYGSRHYNNHGISGEFLIPCRACLSRESPLPREKYFNAMVIDKYH